MHRLSLHESDFDEFKSLKVSRFEEFLLAPHVIERCRAWQPIPKSMIASNVCGSSKVSISPVRVVVPYRKYLYV